MDAYEDTGEEGREVETGDSNKVDVKQQQNPT